MLVNRVYFFGLSATTVVFYYKDGPKEKEKRRTNLFLLTVQNRLTQESIKNLKFTFLLLSTKLFA